MRAYPLTLTARGSMASVYDMHSTFVEDFVEASTCLEGRQN